MTIVSITATMRRMEKVINYYNKKYEFDLTRATKSERVSYDAAIAIWDGFKVKRDELKAERLSR